MSLSLPNPFAEATTKVVSGVTLQTRFGDLDFDLSGQETPAAGSSPVASAFARFLLRSLGAQLVVHTTVVGDLPPIDLTGGA